MVAGTTCAYEFAPSDTLTISVNEQLPMLRQLLDSKFQALEWHVRTGGKHGKARTVRRGQ